MKMLLWLLVAYEGGVGVAEIASSALGSNSSGAPSALVTVAQLPSVGSLTMSSSVMTGGLIDVGVAGAIYYFGLHKKL